LLDSRENREFEVSHLKDASYVGYDSFNIMTVLELVPDKQDTIIVYCSLGIRSEDIGEKIQDAGYTHVYNLYGGIFEWKNKDKLVYTGQDIVTEEVHAFSIDWSKWLYKGIKIYE
jgi:rhodanese-related sulfurtransferase